MTISSTPARSIPTCAACARNSVRPQNISIQSAGSDIDSWKNEAHPALRPSHMWPVLIGIILTAAGALHFWWWRQVGELRRQLAEQQRSLAAQKAQHEQAAAQIQAQQQAVFNSMVEGVLVLDGANRVQLINPSLQRLFSPGTDVRGQTILEAFRLQELSELTKRVQHEGTIQNYTLELPGMEERWVEVSAAAVLGRDGAQPGAILVFHDLTRIKQLERTRQEFVANVSHELRTPLSLIKGFVETLLDGAKDNPDVATKFLQTIDRNAERLRLLIEDLLTISEMESGRVKLELQTIALQPLVAKVFGDLQSRAETKRIEFLNQVADF